VFEVRGLCEWKRIAEVYMALTLNLDRKMPQHYMCFENSKIVIATVRQEKSLNFPEDISSLKAGIHF